MCQGHIHPSTTNCHFSPSVRVAPSQCRSATWSRRSAGLGPSYESCSGCTRPHCNWSIFSFRPSPAWTHDDNGGDTRRAPSRGSAAIPSGIAWLLLGTLTVHGQVGVLLVYEHMIGAERLGAALDLLLGALTNNEPLTPSVLRRHLLRLAATMRPEQPVPLSSSLSLALL